MIISSKDYADFKNAVAMLRHLDGVFYNTSISTPSFSTGAANPTSFQYGVGISGQCFIAAYDLVAGICVQMVMGASAPNAATITGDFPSAVATNSYFNTAAFSVFGL